MSAPEVNVEVVVPPAGDQAEESGAPEVVVVETAPPSGGTDPAAILSMEMLRDQVEAQRAEVEALKNQVAFLTEWQSSQSQRLAELEEVEEVEEEIESSEIVAEVIPATVETSPETRVEETEPQPRKRRFI